MNNHKYGAIATELDGIRFASRAEARRYQELKLLVAAGEINSLVVHPQYPLFPEDKRRKLRAVVYEADFMYIEEATGTKVVEDVKGVRTAVYRLKRNILLRTLAPGWEFREIEA
jgi:hypothetical protein